MSQDPPPPPPIRAVARLMIHETPEGTSSGKEELLLHSYKPDTSDLHPTQVCPGNAGARGQCQVTGAPGGLEVALVTVCIVVSHRARTVNQSHTGRSFLAAET